VKALAHVNDLHTLVITAAAMSGWVRVSVLAVRVRV
jgi:hypothetical protein